MFNTGIVTRTTALLGALAVGAALAPVGPARAAAILYVDTTADVLAVDGACSLREAINAAGSNVEHPDCGKGSADDFDSIFLQAGATYDLTKNVPAFIDNQSGDLDIVNNPAPIDLYLIGDPVNPPTIRSTFAKGPQSRVVEIAEGATVFLQYLTVTGGKADGTGGGILNKGDLTLTDVQVTKNQGVWGGGIGNESGAELTLGSGSDVHHNTSSARGGGISNESGTVTVEDGSLVRDNQAAHMGGGISSGTENNKPALVFIRESSVVQGNTASGDSIGGGGVFNGAGSGLLIEDSIVAQNTADGEGGGVYSAQSGSLIVKGSTIAYNVARKTGNTGPAGGGVANYATGSISTSSIHHNSTGDAEGNTGGGIHNGGSLTVDRSALYTNATVGPKGGGIYTTGALKLINSTLNGNIGTFAVYASNVKVDILNSTIVGNSGGLAIESNAPGSVISRSIIANNNVVENCSLEAALVSQGYNVLGEDCGVTPVATDKVGVDPKLLTLDNNGGPTMTNALAGNSPAKNMIPNAVCAVVAHESQKADQRGMPRPQGLGCDAGAYEDSDEIAIPAPVPVLTTLLPNKALVNGGKLLLTVSGSNFTNKSQVRRNGVPLETTYMNATTLSALLPAEALATIGKQPITVHTPAPGGGTSNAVDFEVYALVIADPDPQLPVKHTVFTPMVGR